MLVATSAALADQQVIAPEEVKAYFQQVEREATALVADDELERIVAWIDHNIAGGAVLQASINIIRGAEPKGFAAVSLDKPDMLQIGGVFAGAMMVGGCRWA